MIDKQKVKPELLAPAGSINAFERALEAGADAVYIGAPALNARALSRDFSLGEIGAMVQFAHEKGVKLYLAANSLLKESEIPQALETLAMLEELQPDALIIQDLGVYNLCRKYFPDLRLHASTLLGAHNSLAVRQFEKMGFKRVVLARELTIKEIGAIARKSQVELEVFVHGALCFSYSGLCLFSSYLGGKSGLRGRCVQPCRRRYQWKQPGEKPGYYFSMNDLSSIDHVHELLQVGISSLKIEGRLKSSHYVASVVKAYRMVIDAGIEDRSILDHAEELLNQAMGRKTSQGYFSTAESNELISPYHSGNIGLYLGQAGKGTGKGRVSLALKQPLQVGDRLRLHQEDTGERVAFTLRNVTINGRKVSQAKPGEAIILEVPAVVMKGDSLYKVDSRTAREAEKVQSGV
ncbi:MAG: U32 family peptidase, partial [Deltaproteobacteria bacterium]|nr:U32 family peptidase [Deltaproteobacteria bacterium]